jgi:septation ring formation regulator EzrA
MDKLQKLELMDKVVRELEDLKNSQVSILKKLSQIEADNITLNVSLLENKLPDLHEEIESSVEIVNHLLEELQVHREKYFVDNKLAATLDPTA